MVLVLCGGGVLGYREDCGAGFASVRKSILQVPLQEIDCDKKETKEGFVMGYGKSMVCYFGSREVMGTDREAE
jgi:hypothetical protein